MYHLHDDINKEPSKAVEEQPNTTKVTVDLVELDEIVDNQPVQFIASEFEGQILDDTLFAGNYICVNLIKNIRRSC